jgi:hypothetical protein
MNATELERLASLLMNVDEATALLPEDERRRYAEARDSVIEARRAAERMAHEVWIG